MQAVRSLQHSTIPSLARTSGRGHNGHGKTHHEHGSSSFPRKLYQLLATESTSIIEWIPTGKAFRLVDIEQLQYTILPKYFKHQKLTSFQRQLNLYGFRRVMKGEDQGAYFHPRFQYGRADLLSQIRRLPSSANHHAEVVSNLSYLPPSSDAAHYVSVPVANAPHSHQDAQRALRLNLAELQFDEDGPMSMPMALAKSPSASASVSSTTNSTSNSVSPLGMDVGVGLGLKRSLSNLSMSSCMDWADSLNGPFITGPDDLDLDLLEADVFDSFELML